MVLTTARVTDLESTMTDRFPLVPIGSALVLEPLRVTGSGSLPFRGEPQNRSQRLRTGGVEEGESTLGKASRNPPIPAAPETQVTRLLAAHGDGRPIFSRLLAAHSACNRVSASVGSDTLRCSSKLHAQSVHAVRCDRRLRNPTDTYVSIRLSVVIDTRGIVRGRNRSDSVRRQS